MLDTLRQKSKGIFSWIVLSIISCVFILFGVKGVLSSNDKLVAKINGEKIYKNELDVLVNDYIKHKSKNTITKEQKNFIYNGMLRNIIDTKMIVTELKNNGFVVTDKQITEYISNIDDFKDSEGNFSYKSFQEFVAKTGISENKYLEDLNNFLLSYQYRQAIAKTDIIFPYELKEISKLYDQRRDVGYVELTHDNIKILTPNVDELKKYYEDNKDKYKKKDLFDAEISYVNFDSVIDSVVITDERSKDYYYNNLVDFTEQEQWKLSYIAIIAEDDSDLINSGEAGNAISDIHAKLKLGGDFNKVSRNAVKEHSADSGKLGWVTKNPQFPQEVFKLKTPGEVSDVITLDSGMYVFKLEDKKEYKQKSFDDVKAMIVSRLKVEDAEEIVYSKIEQLEDIISSDDNYDMEKLSNDLDISYEKKQKVSLDTLFGNFKGNIKDSDKNNLVENSIKLFDIDRRNAMILKMNKRYNGEFLKFENKEVKVKVLNDLTDELKSSQVKVVTKLIWNDLSSGVMPNDTCKKHNVKWTVIRNLPRHSLSKDNDKIKKLAFLLPDPKKNLTDIPTSGYQLYPETNSSLVVSVSTVSYGDLSNNLNSSEMGKRLTQSLMSSSITSQLTAMLDDIKSKSKIKIYTHSN